MSRDKGNGLLPVLMSPCHQEKMREDEGGRVLRIDMPGDVGGEFNKDGAAAVGIEKVVPEI